MEEEKAMSCQQFDWKGYVLDEVPSAERRLMDSHLPECAECRQELDGLRLTMTALGRLPVREIPRRISFVSDPVFEPKWWQRFWSSGPQLGFASAALLACAILAHGWMARPAAAPVMTAGVTPQQVEEQIQQEVARRLPLAVDERVQTQLKPAMADVSARMEQYQKLNDDRRRADLRDVDSAFTLFQKRFNAMVLSNARYGGD
jgi:protein involved in polysaccharide export with SLBB domain